MDDRLILYHGSSFVIERPMWGVGNPHNDYGLGFYCTENLELAKEWGVSEAAGAFANEYELDVAGLDVLNLNGDGFTILHWLAVLLENRTFRVSGNIAPLAKEFILERFAVDYRQRDIVRGYRADDSYFSFANAFLNNALTLGRLQEAMALGNLGEQVVLLSERAFSRIAFKRAHVALREDYYPRKMARDSEARSVYRSEVSLADIGTDPTVLTIMREDWREDDERLRRVVPG